MIVLFYAVSFYALREFLASPRPGAAALVGAGGAFYLALPLPMPADLHADWYGLFSIFIPVYVFLLLPILASSAATAHFLERPPEGAMGR